MVNLTPNLVRCREVAPCPAKESATGALYYFCAAPDAPNMSHDHHDHSEAEQNEIGGPVVLAVFLFAIVITVLYFLS